MPDTPIPAIDMWAPIAPAGDVMAHLVDYFPLPLPPAIMEKWLWRNAARLLGLPS